MEETLEDMRAATQPGFRLFLTAQPHPAFPLALMQMSVKVCNEPPEGLRAGLERSYSSVISQVRDTFDTTPRNDGHCASCQTPSRSFQGNLPL